jgi:hypothetical protein
MRHAIPLAQVTFLFCIAAVSPAKAGDNVQTFLQKCTSQTNATDISYCYGRVTGIFETMGLNGASFSHQFNPLKTLTVCVDPPPSYGAEVQAFINWANNHPEKWGMPDSVGVAGAMSETWPCQ